MLGYFKQIVILKTNNLPKMEQLASKSYVRQFYEIP